MELQTFSNSFSANLQALTARMTSLSTVLSSTAYQLDKLLGTSPTQTPVTIAIYKSTYSGGVKFVCPLLDSTSSGGVALHHHIFGLPLPPPPKMSRFNIPRLRLYTGRRHGPRAANLHQLPHLTCGTRHQPRAPNQFTGSLGTVWFGGLLLCLADDCFSAEHWISWVIGYLGLCIACLVSWVSSHMPLFPFHGYAINRGGVLPL